MTIRKTDISSFRLPRALRFVLPALLLSVAGARAAVEQIVVTATRPPEPVGQAAFSVTTLDAADLTQSDRLDAALEQVPGLSLFRRSSSLSANPTTQGVSLRSIAPSGAGRALVLLDGVPMNDPFGGWVIWTALPGEDIARAEIVRGAGAGPYGAGALTGTISLSEREGDGLAMADVSAGSLGTARAAVSGGATLGKVSLFASASGEHSDGWTPVRAPQRGLADRPLWFNGGSASLRAQAPLGGDMSVAARIGIYDEARGNGLEGGKAGAHGLIGSVTLARAATERAFRLAAAGLDREERSDQSVRLRGAGPQLDDAGQQTSIARRRWAGASTRRRSARMAPSVGRSAPICATIPASRARTISIWVACSRTTAARAGA